MALRKLDDMTSSELHKTCLKLYKSLYGAEDAIVSKYANGATCEEISLRGITLLVTKFRMSVLPVGEEGWIVSGVSLKQRSYVESVLAGAIHKMREHYLNEMEVDE